jgi:sugar phosphate isomerase/epimerase
VVNGADAANGGLVIDTWHMSKLGITPDDLRRIPLPRLAWVELSDGFYENMDDPVDETVNHRQLPGEGEFPLPAYIAVCRELGYEGPWGVEVLSEDLRALPIEQIFERAYETSMSQLNAERSAGV